jgi:ABC-type dipeptide/oligopeptide/nickel transport system ATPase component
VGWFPSPEQRVDEYPHKLSGGTRGAEDRHLHARAQSAAVKPMAGKRQMKIKR